MKKDNAFSLVELLIIISIIGILSAIAVPMYAKYTFRANMVGILNQAEPIMLQMEDYISANTDTQEGLDHLDVKNTYLGTADQEFMVISGYNDDSDFVAANPDYVSNNGRIVYSRDIGSTTYDIALTPRITNKTLKWDCAIYDATNAKYPDADLLPSECNTGDVENDDQLNYDFNYLNLNGEDGTGGTALKDGYSAASSAWSARIENAKDNDPSRNTTYTLDGVSYSTGNQTYNQLYNDYLTKNSSLQTCKTNNDCDYNTCSACSTQYNARRKASAAYNGRGATISDEQKDNNSGLNLSNSNLIGSFTDDMIETYQEYSDSMDELNNDDRYQHTTQLQDKIDFSCSNCNSTTVSEAGL